MVNWVRALPELFKAHADSGISPEQIASATGSVVDRVHKTISCFRKKGYNIVYKGGLYFDPQRTFERPLPQIPQVGAVTLIYDVLRRLKDAGEKGVLISELSKERKRTSVQSAILDLRTRGLRIDCADGRYIFKGRGVSVLVNPISGRATRILGRTKAKSARSSPEKIVPRVNKTGGVISVVQEKLQGALKILPDDAKKGLQDLVKKVESYNEVVRFYTEANEEKNRILTGA